MDASEHKDSLPMDCCAATRTQSLGSLDILLPGGELPDAVMMWIEGRQSKDLSEGGKFQKQMRAATEWVLEVLCRAHEDLRLKKAGRKLLAVRHFTTNLDADGAWCFRDVLKPGLRKYLQTLATKLSADFDSRNLGDALSNDVVAAAVGDPKDHRLYLARRNRLGDDCGRPTQVDVLPWLTAAVDFCNPEQFPDDIYVHLVLMAAAILNHDHQTAVATIVNSLNSKIYGGHGTAKCSAASIKAYARMKAKVRSDYRYEASPRAQHNVDVVRCLVSAETPEELLALAKDLSVAFGGVVRVKNLFPAPLSERSERFHLLLLMLTVAVDGGETFGERMQRPMAREAVDAYVRARDPTVPPHRWAETTKHARAMLESGALSGMRAQVLGEVQMALTVAAEVRDEMHEVYKAFRAESALLLWEDYARTAADEGERGEIGMEDLAEVPKSLWWAASRGNRPATEAFLTKSCVNVNTRNGSRTALSQASYWGHTDVVKVLVEAGADVDRPGHRGRTPLFVASASGHTDVIHVLIGAHANVNQANTASSTPLYIAAGKGYVDVVQVLINALASVNLARTDTGTTPLCRAAINGHLDVVQVLIDAHADVNQARTDTGATPLWWAAQQGRVDIVQVLVDAYADINKATTDTGSTPLFTAVLNGHVDVIKVLLSVGADVNQSVADTGATPLCRAAEKGHFDVVQVLVDAHADVNQARTDTGATPLWWAAQQGRVDIVQVLVDAHADINKATTDTGSTPLFTAALNGHVDVIKVLLSVGADVNQARSDTGATPLCKAAEKGHADVVELLVAAGAKRRPHTVAQLRGDYTLSVFRNFAEHP
jgi:ankyrin repeat protein